MTRASSTERTPLLPQDQLAHKKGNSTSRTLSPVTICVLLVLSFTMFGHYHVMAPKLRLLEMTICRSFYSTRDPSLILSTSAWPGYYIDEGKCKHTEIQERVSTLRSWSALLDGLCALLLSIPYGILADRYGRKEVYLSSILGLVLNNGWFLFVCSCYTKLPVSAVISSSIFLIIGGGSWVVLAISTTMIADAVDGESRSTVFYWMLSVYYVAYVAAMGLSPVTMRSLPLPFFLALAAALVATAILLLMPRTEPVLVTHQANDLLTEPPANKDWAACGRLKKPLRAVCQHVHFTKSNPRLTAIALVASLLATRNSVSELTLPYVSKRYSWPLSNAGALEALNGGISLMLGTIVLPWTIQTLSDRGIPAQMIDSYVARYSAGALCLGSFLVGLAPNASMMIAGWIAFSTGFGARMSVLAVATSLVLPHQVSRMTTVLVAMETFTDMTVSPLVWRLWSSGLRTGGVSMGYPWFAVAGAMMVATFILWSIDFRKQQENRLELQE